MILLLILFALLAAFIFASAWLADRIIRIVERAVQRRRQRVVCAWRTRVMRRGWRSATVSHGLCRRCAATWQQDAKQRATPPAKAA